ncbi:hypothetical protein E1286_31155 [Nonomuraea terrae]|uniref:Uncharacterized protein n=1 Tax=Nonomuraea terrae TaxID=2530383 RepID=A0A4R4YGB6_9ACTN|nr:hypothetical protein [Nonomuraea terrae]TDD42272.1 hypothetical protein E1286_31155 [Nonomuraea terrae]
MSNGARHALGVVAGLFLPAIVTAALWYGVGDFGLQAQRDFRISWPAVAALAAAALLLAFLAGSRLSPIASLFGGLGFTTLGVLPVLELLGGTPLLPDDLLPGVMRTGMMTVAYSGLQAALGVMLLVVSMFPSRWRAFAARSAPEVAPAYDTGYDKTPSMFQPYNEPEDTTRPMFRQ